MNGFSKLDIAQIRFYDAIGRCLTEYVFMEDYLQEVFEAALGGDSKRAEAIFTLIRGLDNKLKIIAAALIDLDNEIAGKWRQLCARIRAATEQRNHVAHSRVTNNSGRFAVTLDKSGRPVTCERVKDPGYELRKIVNQQEKTLSTEDILEEIVVIERIQIDLSLFKKALSSARMAV